MKDSEKILRWCAYDTDFAPSRIDNWWATRGLSACCTFVQKGTLQSFQVLTKRYGLEGQDFYRYLQMRHRFDEIITEEDSETIEHGTLQIFICL